MSASCVRSRGSCFRSCVCSVLYAAFLRRIVLHRKKKETKSWTLLKKPEHLWPTMVMRKWLNIGSKESDYSDDPADDNEDDTESDSDTEEWGRQSRFRDSRVDEAPNEESNGRRTSIACSKQLNNGSLHQQEEEEAAQTPTTKQAIKALTAQIKDMAGKASGAYKNCKPCLGSSNGNKNRKYADSDNGSDSAREIFFSPDFA